MTIHIKDANSAIATDRKSACLALLRQSRTILAKEGSTPSALHALKLKLAALASRTELFPAMDFAMPVADGRLHTLAMGSNDDLALQLFIALPGRMSNPHSHGIWCVNAAVSGRERNVLWRRTDDGSKPGCATIKRIGEVIVERGHAYAMADHDIHSQEVVGDTPAVVIALYGYPFEGFPSVVWYSPEFSTVRALPSRRGVGAA